ncbi:MAG TPA: hypothetical protein VFB16_08045 [Bauldia sp.]|nr:hypothetical protein [Bauldia sp.]
MTDRSGEMRREDEMRPRRRDHSGAWVGAVVLIAVGVIFLLRNWGMPLPDNWWALFLLIPAAGAATAAWRAYNAYGEVNGAVAGPLLGAAILVALAVIFLLDVNIDWQMVWPVILIVIGVGLLLRNYRRR